MKQTVQFENRLRQDIVRVENNLINSFRLLQDTLNQNLEEVHLKTSVMEDRIMDILHAKERAILRMNTSIEALTRNLEVVEESINNLASRSDWYSSMETHVSLRLEKFSREHLQKMDQFESELAKIESRVTTDLGGKINESHLVPVRDRLESLQAKIDGSKQISNYHSQVEVSSIRQQLKELNKLVSKIMDDNNRHERIIKNIEDNSYQSMPIEQVTEKKREQNFETQEYTSIKVPSRERIASPNFAAEEEPVETMEVGLKALRRSKEKREATLKQNPLFHKPSPMLPTVVAAKKKELPPLVKQDTFKGKRNISPVEQDPESSTQFFVGEDGYIIDRDGNYVRDEGGNLIEYTADMEEMEDQY